VDKRSAVHQRRRGIRWTALALVHPTAGAMINAGGTLSKAVRFSMKRRPSASASVGLVAPIFCP
jgi:hypothetical protein